MPREKSQLMPRKEGAYVCNNCGYLLPKKDAVVSGWDSEHSQMHAISTKTE